MTARKILIVFDVDGTLVDSQHAIVSAMSEAYVRHGLSAPSREAIVGVVGLSVAEAVAELSRDAAGHPHAAIGQAFKTIFRESVTASKDESGLYPGAEETLRALHARDDVLLALATGNSRRGVERFLDRFGFEHLFVSTKCADDAPSKPNPVMIELACAEAGVPAVDAVMVGDTTFDMAMGRNAGARSIGVSWGYHPRDRLLAAGAETVIASFDALEAAIGLSTRAELR